MADTASIAIRRDQAMRRLQDGMKRIGAVTGVAAVELPMYDADKSYLEAWRLDVLATYAENVAGSVEIPLTGEQDFSDEDLLNLAIALAMNPPADVKRADLVQLIRAEVTPHVDTEAATATTEAPAVLPYADLKRTELEALVAQREGIVVTGTGSNGYVQVGDLQAALKAWDEAHAADEGDEEGEG